MRVFWTAWVFALLLTGAVLVPVEGGGSGAGGAGASRAAPPVPEPLFPYNGAPYVPTTPTLVCKEVVDPDSDVLTYEFCLDDASDFSSPIFTASPAAANDTSLAIGTDWTGSLASNTTYYWRARARDAGSTSAWSSGWSFKVDSSTYSIWDVVAPVSNSTALKYWNYTDLVWKSFGHANGVMAENGLKVWFSVSEIYLFYQDGWAEASTYQGHGRGLVVLFDEGGSFGAYYGAGWYMIGQNFLWGSEGIASDTGMDALMHELGHYRGVPDLYLYNVAPEDNGVVPGMGHKYTDKNPPDLMDYPYGVHVMQNYTRCLINQTGNETQTQTVFDVWHGEFGPEYNYIIVRDKAGAPVVGASVKIYTNAAYKNLTGGFAFGSSFDAYAERSGTTGLDGAFLFAQKYGKATDLGFDLCFVNVTWNYTSEYAFLEGVETGGLFWGYKKAPLLLNGSVFDVLYTNAVLPGQPRNLSTTSGNGFAVLNWDPPASDGRSPVTAYRVYRGTVSGEETLLITLGNVTSFNDTTLAPLQRYYYKVSAVNAIGEGPKTVEISALSTTTKPGAPRELRATAGDMTISLAWEAPSSDGGSPVIGYRIYRGLGGEDRSFLVAIGNKTAYGDPLLENGVAYRYTVSAFNIAGEGLNSTEVEAVPATLPGAPMDLRAVAGDRWIALNWSAPLSDGGLPIEAYLIYRGTAPLAASFLAELDGSASRTYTDQGLTNGQIYYYNITARTGAGEGVSSEEIDEIPFTLPGVPLELRAVEGDGRVNLSWKAPSSDGGAAVSGYRVYRGLSPGEETFLANKSSGIVFADTGLTNGETYYYRVSAVNRAGEGPLSGAAEATPATTPSAPKDMNALAGDGQVRLTWKAPDSDGGSRITNYSVYRGAAVGEEVLVTELGNQSSFNDTGLANGQLYYYVIRAVNRVGAGAPSAWVAARPMAPPPMKYRLDGHVYREGTKQPISGATLSVAGGVSISTNATGEYMLMLGNGNYSITVSAPGYQPATMNLTVTRADATKDIFLSPVAVDGGGGPEPAKTMFEQMWFWALVIVATTISVLVAIYALRRGRKTAPTPEDVAGPDELPK